MIKRIYKTIKNRIFSPDQYDFNKANPLGGNGERVDIKLSKRLNYNKLDIYQKSHITRYEFAKNIIREGDVCADWACGTGYGSVLLSSKAFLVKAADINGEIIRIIQKRYRHVSNVSFEIANLLTIRYHDVFDIVVSFETIEHFKEENIPQLLAIYNRALKKGGKIIFSTPYMQEKSTEAIKLGFHFTFYIDENKINTWLEETGFEPAVFYYQDYQTHHIQAHPGKKDFVVCVAKKVQ